MRVHDTDRGERTMLHEYYITFHLNDAQVARLVALTAQYNRIIGSTVTPEGLLESLLTTGSSHTIDERMAGIAAALEAEEKRRGTA